MLLKDAKILIGDDSILARKQLKDILSPMGAVRFIEAVNGKETVEKYIAEKPDIIFLDIIMPIKDGITAVKEIIAEDPAAQIIIVSSVGTQQQLKSARQNFRSLKERKHSLKLQSNPKELPRPSNGRPPIPK